MTARWRLRRSTEPEEAQPHEAHSALGIVMHGVTGRMGMNQHLIRSIVAIRDAGRRAARQRRPRHARSDPDRPQRREDRGPGARPRHRALGHQPRRRAGRPERHGLLRRRHDADAPHAARAGAARRQARLLREADRHQPERGGGDRAPGAGLGPQARRGAGQAVPARPAQARRCCAARASSAACSRCAASSATGSSRATCSRSSARAGTTAPRTAAASSSTCSATGATCSTTCSARCRSVSCLGATHIPERWDEAGQPYKATADDAAYATFQLKGTGERRRAVQQLVDDARAPRRSGHLPRRRHARLGGGRAAGLPRPAARGDAAAGVEPRRQAADGLLRTVAAGARDRRSTTTASRSSGRPSSATSSRTRPTAGRCPKAPRACSSSRRAAELEGAALDRRAAADGLSRSRRRHGACSRLEPTARPPTRHDSPPLHAARDAAGRLVRAGRVRARRSTRIAYSAAHVVADARAAIDPWLRLRDRLGRDHRLPRVTCGTSASAWPRRWTPRSAAWGSTGRPRSS